MNTINKSLGHLNPLADNPSADEVFSFCKENGISVTWDFSRKLGVAWNEIMFDDKLLMQIDRGITLKQFLRVIKALHKDFNETDFPTKPGEKDFDFTCQDKELFDKFVKKHKKILLKK
jgi:hypothetical protein